MNLTLNQTEIIKLLHHRPPYLLVERVIEASSIHIKAEVTPKLSDFYIQGHFPGAHVVPGAMMQEMTTQTAGILLTKFHAPVEDYNSETTKGYALGVLKKINYARLKHFARPGQVLSIEVKLLNQLDNLFEFEATVSQNNSWVMKNSFQLVNIKDEHILD
jgi:3-hydroxyacyl-[acyl-carrier-protein] dehydratase